jgi:deoxyribodipyrimidine photolyase-related protein
MTVRWIFGDQLGPHFTEDLKEQDRVILIVSKRVLARKRYHRAKAHLMLSAMHHRAAELGERAVLMTVDRYADALDQLDPDEVIDPTSAPARAFVRSRPRLQVLPSRGFATEAAEFDAWALGRGERRLLLEDWYRQVRTRHDVLMDGDPVTGRAGTRSTPTGGRWNFDHDNRLPPPRGAKTLGLPPPWQPAQDAIDEAVRDQLDAWQASGEVTFIGEDGPRQFAATRQEALLALDDFVAHRLPDFGPYEDAVLAQDWAMGHSLLSPAMNLGLVHPMEVVQACIAAYRAGAAPLQSVEAITRQILGWREYVWHLYWRFVEEDRDNPPNALEANEPVPSWFAELKADEVSAACLRGSLRDVQVRGWSHHIVRLMILGNWALQRGYQPQAMTDWFTRAFVDGYPWVMTANVIGMSLYADGGRMATKPYAAGGAYIKRMTDFCGTCAYRPEIRVGPKACPFAAGYWAFLHRHRQALRSNHRMSQPLKGLDRLADLDELLIQEQQRGGLAP